jgi:hypothetical protein
MTFELAGVTLPSRQEFKDQTQFGMLAGLFRPRSGALRAIDENLGTLEEQVRRLPGSGGEQSRLLGREIGHSVNELRNSLASWLAESHRRNTQPATDLLSALDDLRIEEFVATALDELRPNQQQAPQPDTKQQLASQSRAEVPRSPPPIYAPNQQQATHRADDRPPSYADPQPVQPRRGIDAPFPLPQNPPAPRQREPLQYGSSAEPQPVHARRGRDTPVPPPRNPARQQRGPMEQRQTSVQSQMSPQQGQSPRPVSRTDELMRSVAEVEDEAQGLASEHGRSLGRDSTLEGVQASAIYGLYDRPDNRGPAHQPTPSTSQSVQSRHSPPSGQRAGRSSGERSDDSGPPRERGSHKGGRTGKFR